MRLRRSLKRPSANSEQNLARVPPNGPARPVPAVGNDPARAPATDVRPLPKRAPAAAASPPSGHLTTASGVRTPWVAPSLPADGPTPGPVEGAPPRNTTPAAAPATTHPVGQPAARYPRPHERMVRRRQQRAPPTPRIGPVAAAAPVTRRMAPRPCTPRWYSTPQAHCASRHVRTIHASRPPATRTRRAMLPAPTGPSPASRRESPKCSPPLLRNQC